MGQRSGDELGLHFQHLDIFYFTTSCHSLKMIIDGVYVGQNIATIYGDSPGLAPLSLVDVWYMELLNVNATILPHYKP